MCGAEKEIGECNVRKKKRWGNNKGEKGTHDSLVDPAEPAKLRDLPVSSRSVLDEGGDHGGRRRLAQIIGDGFVDVRSALQDLDVVELLYRRFLAVSTEP